MILRTHPKFMTRAEIETKLLEVFKQAFTRGFSGTNHSVHSVEDWDSLSHIRLILLIEQEFSLMIDPDQLADLYTSFENIVTFLESQSG